MIDTHFFLPAQDILAYFVSSLEGNVRGDRRIDSDTLEVTFNSGVRTELDVGPVRTHFVFRDQYVDVYEARLFTPEGVLFGTFGEMRIFVSGSRAGQILNEGYVYYFHNGDDYLDALAWSEADSIDDVSFEGPFYGGGGQDTVFLNEPSDLIRLTSTQERDDSIHVYANYNGSVAEFVDFERFQFSDCTVEVTADGQLVGCGYRLDLSQEDVQIIALLFEAGLDRNGSIAVNGLNFWIDRREEGMSEEQLATAFLQSTEFRNAYGEALDSAAPDYLSDRALVERLFLNVLDRPGAQGGIDFWSGELTKEEFSRADLLVAFAQSPENLSGSPFVETMSEVSPGVWDFA